MSLSISDHYTPMASSVGGAIIGIAADTLLLANGDVMGASGIVSSVLLSPISAMKQPQSRWKLVFAASFLTTSTLLAPYYNYNNTDKETAVSYSLSSTGFAIAGLFVGFGTKLGNGCTSGHGICGLGRLSPRSFASVMTFLPVGILTTIMTSPSSSHEGSNNRLLGAIQSLLWNDGPSSSSSYAWGTILSLTSLAAAATAAAAFIFQSNSNQKKDDDTETAADNSKSKLVPAAISGALFAVGLYISKMVYQSKVYGFLKVSDLLDATAGGGWVRI